MEGAQVSGVSYFRNRAYDSRTGRWLQEDPIGVAGGLNLYQFNGNNPVTYTDPFGLCPMWWDGIPCTAYSTGADLSKLRPEARSALFVLANVSGHDLGIYQATEGPHNDPRHALGLGVDINEIDRVDVGSTGHMNAAAATLVGDVDKAAKGMNQVRTVLGPLGHVRSDVEGGAKFERQFEGKLKADHQSHLHVTFYAD